MHLTINLLNYQLVDQIQLPEKNKLKPILFRDNDDYLILKRIIYTRWYLSSTHVSDLKVYRKLQNTHIYYLQNQKKVKKLILEI